jgi:hypothetical protein
MNSLMIGAIAMACMVAGLCFLRYWKNTRDRFFLLFALSFGVEAINRIIDGLVRGPGEDRPLFYGVRLLSYALILWAILDKNRPRRDSGG